MMHFDELCSHMKASGYITRVVKSDHLNDLQKEMDTLRDDAVIDQGLHKKYLTDFQFTPSHTGVRPQSLIIVAVPAPQYELTFHLKGRDVDVLLPPTYLFWKRDRHKAEAVLTEFLQEHGYTAAHIRIPLKLLAARSGLTRYGRNNISYLETHGSYHRLVAFISDMPCTEDEWIAPQLAAPCKTCAACMTNCPTKAITADRFLIYAEKCLTYHNEQPSPIPFPDWIDPSWHNCLIGCMKCQSCCPMNHRQKVEKGPSFSTQETLLLMTDTQPDPLPPALIKKLDNYDMTEYLDVLPRNLTTLIH